MRTRTGGTPTNGPGSARRDRPARARRRDGAGWRSHTFSDGMQSITLPDAPDAETADRLRVRLAELIERGCERLIVDVSAAGELGAAEGMLLARAFETHSPNCEVVVVAVPRSALAGLLPSTVAVAPSLSDARRLLAYRTGRRHARQRPAPAGAIAASDRHVLAVRQALRWAARSAGAGDYDSALRALATIERVEGTLSDHWQERRQTWTAASREQTTPTPRPNQPERPPRRD